MSRILSWQYLATKYGTASGQLYFKNFPTEVCTIIFLKLTFHIPSKIVINQYH